MNNKKGTHRNGVPFFIMRFQEAAGTGKNLNGTYLQSYKSDFWNLPSQGKDP